MRDEFSAGTKQLLANRVGHRCSNPSCRQSTSGPQSDPKKAINVGVAAHITAASIGGPRFDPGLTPDEREGIGNGIWLCQTCAKLVDSDVTRYSVGLLREWRNQAEGTSIQEIEGRTRVPDDNFLRSRQLMPKLLDEMKTDLQTHPLRREFVILSNKWAYWAAGNEFAYYFEDHSDLDAKTTILVNLNLVREITSGNVRRFVFSEEFVDRLS
jgi:hypothetical protein